jgi:hypothetical protein
MSGKGINGMIRQAAAFAPLLTLLVLLLMPAGFSQAPADERALAVRNAQVRSAVGRAPWQIGHWVGSDEPVPAAAFEILRPNTILSRRFTDLRGGPPVKLLIVHCSDARDMQGHFPPLCYPANGWIEDRTEAGGECTVLVGGRPIGMRLYNFHHMDGLGAVRAQKVLNYFVLPDGTTASDISVVGTSGRKYATSIQGIAQVQVVTPGDMEIEQAKQAAGELLGGVSSILAVLGQGER